VPVGRCAGTGKVERLSEVRGAVPGGGPGAIGPGVERVGCNRTGNRSDLQAKRSHGLHFRGKPVLGLVWSTRGEWIVSELSWMFLHGKEGG
jgi:hypothetical protein